MKKAVAILLVFSLSFCLFSCSGNGKNDITTKLSEKITEKIIESETEEIVPDVSATQNSEHIGVSGTPLLSAVTTADLGFKMLKKSFTQETNALISPVSIMTALSMTANGASGKTLEEMEAVLGADIETLNKNFAPQNYNGNGVSTANSIWFRNDKKRLSVNDTFINRIEKNYGAEWYGKNFDKSTVRDMNRWVSQHTDGMINNMISDIPPEAVIYLINTVMFDAEWEYPYENHNILKNQIFTSESGEKQEVTMLAQRTNTWMKFGLGKTEGIVKRYTNGYSFAAILPLEGVSINAALNSFTGSDFVNAVLPTAVDPTCGTGLYPVNVYLPKFDFECKLTMSDILKDMGMSTAFSQNDADFSNMGTSFGGNIFIGEVYHNTYISLDELGTRAGAASVVQMADGAAPDPFGLTTMNFNRPFIYVIFETGTGTPLFIGTVRDFDV